MMNLLCVVLCVEVFAVLFIEVVSLRKRTKELESMYDNSLDTIADLLAKNDELETKNYKLVVENNELLNKNNKLEANNNELDIENFKLLIRNNELTIENYKLAVENNKLLDEIDTNDNNNTELDNCYGKAINFDEIDALYNDYNYDELDYIYDDDYCSNPINFDEIDANDEYAEELNKLFNESYNTDDNDDINYNPFAVNKPEGYELVSGEFVRDSEGNWMTKNVQFSKRH